MAVSNEYIIDYVTKYINNNIKLPSAIMINGKWGCGKSYFVKEILIPNLKSVFPNKKIAFITLNGISSSQEIEKRIQAAIIKLNLDEKNQENIMETISGLDSCFDNININGVLSVFSGIGKIAKRVVTSKALENTILFFDDLERCTIDANISLGIINDLIEHKKCKCILIANEDEIKQKNTSSIEYNSIKEKFISRTLYYHPNTKDFLHEIYTNTYFCKLPNNVGKVIWKNISNNFLEITDNNLRTLLSAISLINEVCVIIKDYLPDNKELTELIYSEVSLNLYFVEMWYKANHNRPESILKDDFYSYYNFGLDENNKKTSDYRFSFKFAFDIIYDGEFNDEYIVQSINNYIRFQSIDGEVSPLTNLKEWYYLEDDYIQEQYNNMLSGLRNDEVPIDSYQEMLKICFILNDIGFTDVEFSSITEIIDQMEKNIPNHPYFCFQYNGLSSNVDEKHHELLISTLDEFSLISYNHYKATIHNLINGYLKNPDWANLILSIAKEQKNVILKMQGFLYLFDENLLLSVINAASNSELNKFRDSLTMIYYEGVSGSSYPEDQKIITCIADKLMSLDGAGLINKRTIYYIANDLKRYFNIVQN